MAVFLFIGKSFTRRSPGSLSLTSSICLLGWWLEARRGTPSPGMAQLSFQLVNLTQHVPVLLFIGNVTLPTRVTFVGMSCAHTPLTALSPFEASLWIFMLGTSWLCLVQVSIYLVWSCCEVMWTRFLHYERYNRISFNLNQALLIDGANCKDWNCIDPKTGLGSNSNGPNNKFVECG